MFLSWGIGPNPLAQIRADILELKELIMATQKTQGEMAEEMRGVTAQLVVVAGETQMLLDKVTALEEALANAGGVGGTVTQELSDAFDALKAQATVVDDKVPAVAP